MPFLVRLLVNAAERRNSEGKPQFIRLTVFNATDRRRYERELLKARDELKSLATTLERRVAEATAEQLRSDTALVSQREEALLREQFIAVLGHDLRNPLASIFAGIRLIQKSKLDEKAEAIVLMMQKSVMRMASLVDNILDCARGRLGASACDHERDEAERAPHRVTANPQIVAAAFRDGTMPLPTYRRFKTITRLGSRLCRKTWRTAPPRMPCARSVILIYLNCRASCRPRVLGATEVARCNL
jgi:signal transduction histidine kinase